MLLKREIGPKSWLVEAVVGAELMRRGSGFIWRGRSFWIGLESATTLLQISLKGGHNFRHDRARSRHDRATIGRRSCSRCSRKCRLMIVDRFRNECCAIAVRSDRDRGDLPQRVRAVRWRSTDHDGSTCVEKVTNDRGRPIKLQSNGRSDLDRAFSALMKIRRSSCCHVASGESVDRVFYTIYLRTCFDR